MKKLIQFGLLGVLLLTLPGCWNKRELPELGLVMAVALDQGKKGQIEMTTQVFRPSASGSEGGGGDPKSSFINVKTSKDTVFQNIREVPLHLGRRTQWSHMRVIMIGESLARKTDIGKLLDLFFRDHEPRHNVSVLIAKGHAGEYLAKKPIVEQTTGQQLMRIKQYLFQKNTSTIKSTLLEVAKQLKDDNDALLGYVNEENGSFAASGAALIKKGKLIGVLPSDHIKGLLMLLNNYQNGLVVISCPNNKKENEAIEIVSLHSRWKVNMVDDKITVRVKMEVEGALGELRCTELKTMKDEAKLIDQIEKELTKEMMTTIQVLQDRKADVIGVGNHIYRYHPKQWSKMKNNWDERFAQVTFTFHIKTKLITSGTSLPEPVLSENAQ
ncbi:Ger(x)C family spore germination protein [Paenibacillus montanisoli]|uniref:Ger(X)C family spore germination protein n=1 Tax=Paenibacillus montanisoli TaxID=2081970 RepID=A0A328U8R0_9BACL|nr:Ger(x)C family spore germination protein [Paenibacillus montanisoli]RAP77285.1 hypothetical protein DL346_01960 [Paenibacillus montanisoli]